MRFKRDGSVMSVDLHGMYLADAESLLLSWLNQPHSGVTELRVIHGSNRGTALRDMLRNDFHHSKIKSKLPALNPGETRFILK